jgi:hypothetical protein
MSFLVPAVKHSMIDHLIWYLGTVIVSSAVLLVEAGARVSKKIGDSRADRKAKQKLIEMLNNLTMS